MQARDALLGLVIIVIWGVNFVVIAWGLEQLSPMMLGALRFLLVALIGCWWVKRDTPWRWLIGFGLTLGFGQFALLFSAMQAGMSAGLASLVLQSQVLFTLLFARLALDEPIAGYQWLALVIASAGLTLVGWQQQGAAITALGFALTLAAAASWAIGNIVNRRLMSGTQRSGLSLVVWSAWVPPLPFFLCAYLIDGPEAFAVLAEINLTSLLSLLYLALLATIVGYGLWSYLLSRYPASQVSPLTLGVPVVGLTSAGVLLGQWPEPLQWLGISLVMLALVCNTWGGKLRNWRATPAAG